MSFFDSIGDLIGNFLGMNQGQAGEAAAAKSAAYWDIVAEIASAQYEFWKNNVLPELEKAMPGIFEEMRQERELAAKERQARSDWIEQVNQAKIDGTLDELLFAGEGREQQRMEWEQLGQARRDMLLDEISTRMLSQQETRAWLGLGEEERELRRNEIATTNLSLEEQREWMQMGPEERERRRGELAEAGQMRDVRQRFREKYLPQLEAQADVPIQVVSDRAAGVAGADVAQGLSREREATARTMGRYGIDPSSASFQATNRAQEVRNTGLNVSIQNQARRAAEAQHTKTVTSLAGIGLGGGLPKAPAPPNVPAQPVPTQPTQPVPAARGGLVRKYAHGGPVHGPPTPGYAGGGGVRSSGMMLDSVLDMPNLAAQGTAAAARGETGLADMYFRQEKQANDRLVRTALVAGSLAAGMPAARGGLVRKYAHGGPVHGPPTPGYAGGGGVRSSGMMLDSVLDMPNLAAQGTAAAARGETGLADMYFRQEKQANDRLVRTALVAGSLAAGMPPTGGLGGMGYNDPGYAGGTDFDYAEGGEVQGPGTGTSDSIPARLSDGEFVIPAEVVVRKGTEFFDKLIAPQSPGQGGIPKTNSRGAGGMGIPRPSMAA